MHPSGRKNIRKTALARGSALVPVNRSNVLSTSDKLVNRKAQSKVRQRKLGEARNPTKVLKVLQPSEHLAKLIQTHV